MPDLPNDMLVPRVADARDAPALNWGVMGPGWIAERFITSLKAFTRQSVVAIGSRSPDRARDMAARFDVPHAHGSYEALVADEQVDVIYVATPHNAHRDGAVMALRAGRHVLVEKPIAINAREAREIAVAARESGRFCMEAMWTFFLPKYEVLLRVVDEGWIGDVHTLIADHGEYFNPDHRIMRTELAGGPMLDLGTYPVALATRLLGRPERLGAYTQWAASGVHGQVSAALEYAGGNQALIHTTLFNSTPGTATIGGTLGTITVDGMFYMPGRFTIRWHDGREASYSEPAIGHMGLHHQAAAVARSIAAGGHEHTLRSLNDSIATLDVMDAIRERAGIVFVGER